jgi:hypothetical protein
MALRFRRRVKLLPGVHLNISRSGISTSVGVRGASLTFGKRSTYLNTGLAGTGISWRGRLPENSSTHDAAGGAVPATVHPIQGTPKIHHLHWWTVILFIAAMVGAVSTKSSLVLGVFWFGWIGYWLFLVIRLIFRRSRRVEI